MDTTGYPAAHVDTWLGIPYEMLEDMSVREQRVIVKQRVSELRQIEAHRRLIGRAATKPIDTYVNTKLYIKQIDRRNGISPNSKEMPEIHFNEMTPGTVRSRSNVTATSIPYAKKPWITRDTQSDFGNESTTIGMNSEIDSPLIRGNR